MIFSFEWNHVWRWETTRNNRIFLSNYEAQLNIRNLVWVAVLMVMKHGATPPLLQLPMPDEPCLFLVRNRENGTGKKDQKKRSERPLISIGLHVFVHDNWKDEGMCFCVIVVGYFTLTSAWRIASTEKSNKHLLKQDFGWRFQPSMVPWCSWLSHLPNMTCGHTHGCGAQKVSSSSLDGIIIFCYFSAIGTDFFCLKNPVHMKEYHRGSGSLLFSCLTTWAK